MTSPDGISWTLRDGGTNGSWSSVCYGNGMFLAIAKAGGKIVMISHEDALTEVPFFTATKWIIEKLLAETTPATSIVESNMLTVEDNQRRQDVAIALLEARLQTLEEAVYSNVTENPFQMTFESLDDVALSSGIWNQTAARIEC